MIKHDFTTTLSETTVEKYASKAFFTTPRRQTEITSAAAGYGTFGVTLKGVTFIIDYIIYSMLG